MNLRQSVDARLIVEVCLLRAIRPPESDGASAGVAALEARVAALERGGRGAATRRADPVPAVVRDTSVVVEAAPKPPGKPVETDTVEMSAPSDRLRSNLARRPKPAWRPNRSNRSSRRSAGET